MLQVGLEVVITFSILLRAYHALLTLPTPRGTSSRVWGHASATTSSGGSVRRVGSLHRRAVLHDALRTACVWGTYLSLRSWIAWALWLLPFGSTIHTLWLLWMLANPSMATYLLYVSIQPWLREQESYIDEAWLWVHGLYLFSAGGVHRVWHGLRPWLWPTPSHVVEYHMPGWLTLLTPKKQPALVHHDRSDEEEVDLSLRLSPTTRSSSDDKSDEEVGDLSLHAIPWHSTPQVAAPRLVSPPWSPSMPSTTNESPRPKRSIPPTALSEGPTQRSKRTRIPTAKAVAATRSTRPTSQLPRLKRPPSPKAPTKSKAQRTTTTSPRLRPPRARRRAPSS